MARLALLLGAAVLLGQLSGPHEIKVAVDPRSTAEAQSHLIANDLREQCPNVSVIGDTAQADYIVLASESNPLRGALLHYYITIYDKQGKVLFATDKHHGKAASKEACRFLNGQK